jgi:integrase/recombinase XerD
MNILRIAAALPNFSPHSFRNTLAMLGETMCHTVEEFKAWSQNLGHDGVLTTLYSYGEVQGNRQGDIFQQFKEPRLDTASSDVVELAKALVKEMDSQSSY